MQLSYVSAWWLESDKIAKWLNIGYGARGKCKACLSSSNDIHTHLSYDSTWLKNRHFDEMFKKVERRPWDGYLDFAL
jgi:hypothetical protein